MKIFCSFQEWGLSDVFFGRKKRLEVDLGELVDERESLSGFLRSNFKLDVTSRRNRLSIESEELSSQELKILVNKFVYHRNLNTRYWVALEGDVVKIKKFERAKKHEKSKKETTPPSTIKHGW
jgi:hypothetical protein